MNREDRKVLNSLVENQEELVQSYRGLEAQIALLNDSVRPQPSSDTEPTAVQVAESGINDEVRSLVLAEFAESIEMKSPSHPDIHQRIFDATISHLVTKGWQLLSPETEGPVDDGEVSDIEEDVAELVPVSSPDSPDSSISGINLICSGSPFPGASYHRRLGYYQTVRQGG